LQQVLFPRKTGLRTNKAFAANKKKKKIVIYQNTPGFGPPRLCPRSDTQPATQTSSERPDSGTFPEQV